VWKAPIADACADPAVTRHTATAVGSSRITSAERRYVPAVSTAFLLTTLIIVATPGTGVLYTLAAGLSHGARASFVAAVGCTLGIVPHMVAAITGLAALLHTSALAFQSLKYMGVAYLLFMAWSTLRDRSALTVEETAPLSAAKVIVSGILINILNPKLTIFFFAFLPQFVSNNEAHASLRMLELSAVFMLVTLAIFALYGVFAAAVRTHVISRPRVITWMRRVFGGAFVALAGRLALTDR
jgi:threonine/homoserine/homoserine lactone efflux protein